MTFTEAKSALKVCDKDELRSAIEEHGEDVVLAAIACDVQIEDISEAYQGQWKSDEDFVQNLLEDCGEMPKDFPSYIHIDWELAARDVMMDYSEHDGHYFRSL